MDGHNATIRMLFFDTKPYDREHFESQGRDYAGVAITYIKEHLRQETVDLARGFDAVCIFVNDSVDASIAARLHKHGVRLIALRCSGYNNVDLDSLGEGLRVVRVPAYSPHAVAEYTIALMLSLNRKTHRAYSRTRDNNFTLNGLLGLTCTRVPPALWGLVTSGV